MKSNPDRVTVNLTPYRKAMLILVRVLDLAEKGGMEPQDCGAIFEAMETCLVASASDGDVEDTMQSLLDEIVEIIESSHCNSADLKKAARS